MASSRKFWIPIWAILLIVFLCVCEVYITYELLTKPQWNPKIVEIGSKVDVESTKNIATLTDMNLTDKTFKYEKNACILATSCSDNGFDMCICTCEYYPLTGDFWICNDTKRVCGTSADITQQYTCSVMTKVIFSKYDCSISDTNLLCKHPITTWLSTYEEIKITPLVNGCPSYEHCSSCGC